MHDLGHLVSRKEGFVWHSPLAAHPGQSWCRSMHAGLQISHDAGHSVAMKRAFLLQASAAAHCGARCKKGATGAARL